MIENKKLAAWVEDARKMYQPDRVQICDGSKAEYDAMLKLLVDEKLGTPLPKREGSYGFRSDPSDVARVESRTFIASEDPADAGPTNNWQDPKTLKKTLGDLSKGSMKGRTMYVIPFSMGPVGSPMSKIGVQITDSPYVVANMHIMTRVGSDVLKTLGPKGEFIPCLHSVGKPLAKGQSDNGQWPCAPMDQKYIAHFPEEKSIWSHGSGYGGNALLGKKSLALRIASVMARDEGWMAEHMLILRLISPEGKRYHIAAAFPSACGKTNLAMIQPSIPGWKTETIGDDIAWMHKGKDGRLYAINPEAGFFGVAPGTSSESNPMAMKTIEKNTLFTNCLTTDDGDVWWEGMGKPPAHGIDWKGRDWTPESGEPGAHPNARFTAPAKQCPIISPDWENPEGVPIDMIIFGGRRKSLVPLVTEALDWDHGVYMGATCASESTAAALDTKAGLARDPFAMRPFCGYNMGDYFKHWFEMGDKLGDKAPKAFYVNWFRKSPEGKFLWPGYSDNSRVLKWMCDRLEGKVGAQETPIGRLPKPEDMDLSGLKVDSDTMQELLKVDADGWQHEVADVENYMATFGDRLPARMVKQIDQLKQRLKVPASQSV